MNRNLITLTTNLVSKATRNFFVLAFVAIFSFFPHGQYVFLGMDFSDTFLEQETAIAEYADDITSGLVLQYKFNNDLNDSAGSNTGIGDAANMETTDRPYDTDGNTHRLDMSGATDDVVSTNNVGISGASARTLCSWVKMNTIGSGGVQVPVYWGGDASLANFGFFVNATNGNVVSWNYATDDSTGIVTDTN